MTVDPEQVNTDVAPLPVDRVEARGGSCRTDVRWRTLDQQQAGGSLLVASRPSASTLGVGRCRPRRRSSAQPLAGLAPMAIELRRPGARRSWPRRPRGCRRRGRRRCRGSGRPGPRTRVGSRSVWPRPRWPVGRCSSTAPGRRRPSRPSRIVGPGRPPGAAPPPQVMTPRPAAWPASSSDRPSSASQDLVGVLADPGDAGLRALGHGRQLHRVAGDEDRVGARRRSAPSPRSCGAWRTCSSAMISGEVCTGPAAMPTSLSRWVASSSGLVGQPRLDGRAEVGLEVLGPAGALGEAGIVLPLGLADQVDRARRTGARGRPACST